MFGGGGQNCVHVESVAVAAQLDASGGMANDGSIRIRDGVQQALGHLRRFLIEDGVDAGDDDVHLRQYVVGEIESAVSKNIDFDSGEDGDAFDLLVRFADALDVGDGTLVVEPVGEGQILGMIRDGHILVAARLGGLGHFLNGVAAVGFDGMHVHVALNLRLRDQHGQSMVASQIDLAEIFAHLGRNVVEIQLGVDFFFGFSGDRGSAVEGRQTVLVQRVTHLEGALAQGYVMGLRSSEILHGRAERFRGQEANIDLHAAAQVKTDFVVAAGDYVHQRRILSYVGDGPLASFFSGAGGTGDENVEVANGFATPAQRSGGRNLVDSRIFLEICGEFFGFGLGGVDEEGAADAAIVLDGLEQLGLVLFPHARQLANFSFARQFRDALYVTDFVGAPDQGDGLRPQALNLQQLQHRGMIFLEQFGLNGEFAVAEKFLQVPEHAFADAGNRENLFGIDEKCLDGLRAVLDRLGGVAVGADAERILPIDFEQVGGFIKNVGDGLVV